MSINLPFELEEEFKNWVDQEHKGDHEGILIKIVEKFLKEEKSKGPKKVQFDSALTKVQTRQGQKEEILDSEMDAAFKRMKERKEKFDKF